MISKTKQQGASLLVALVMLLVLTVLAASSMRGVVQESRITANRTEQIRLENQSDSATRAAGNLITAKPTALLMCSEILVQPCLKSDRVASDYTVNADFFSAYEGSGDSETQASAGLVSGWYIIPAPDGGAEGQTLNPEHPNRLRGVGTFFYETNAYAQPEDRDSDIVYTRAVFSKTYN